QKLPGFTGSTTFRPDFQSRFLVTKCIKSHYSRSFRFSDNPTSYMNLRVIPLFGLLITSSFLTKGQPGVGIGIANPNKHAVLELVSPGNNQGLLIPKLTTVQRTAPDFVSGLSSKENGLLIFDQDENVFY